MPTFASPLDLLRNELRNAVTQNLNVAPATPRPGQRYFDTVLNVERFFDGLAWVDVGSGGAGSLGDLAGLDQVGSAEIAPASIADAHISPTASIALTKLATNPLDRANHTGTQLAATINDFDSQVRTSRLDQLAVPAATVNLANQVLTNLATPANPADATNKAYVDSVAGGLNVHPACVAATTANIDLAAAPATVDDVTLVNGDRVIVKDQSAPAGNGIYIFANAGAALTRATDADAATGELVDGSYTLVTDGTTNAGTGWIVTTDNPITVGTTAITWAQFSSGGGGGGGGSYTGTVDRVTVTGTQIDIAANYAGQASLNTVGTVATGTWQGTPIGIAYGGTGATTATTARAALGAAGKYATTIGTGVATTFTITHGLGSLDVGVQIYEVATGATLYADVRRSDINTVIVDGFGTAPTASSLRVVVWG